MTAILSGRTGKRTYWTILFAAFFAALLAQCVVQMDLLGLPLPAARALLVIWRFAGLLAAPPCLLILQIRRLHDLGRTARSSRLSILSGPAGAVLSGLGMVAQHVFAGGGQGTDLALPLVLGFPGDLLAFWSLVFTVRIGLERTVGPSRVALSAAAPVVPNRVAARAPFSAPPA